MKPDERSKFLKWYEERVSENYVFDFKKKSSNIADQMLTSLEEV